jgi:effector-binding domain-containing protein
MENINIKEWQKKYLKEDTGMSMEEIVRALLDTTDGQIGRSSVIFRALEAAHYHEAPVKDLAQAVEQALEYLEEEGGSLSSTEF